MDKFISQRESVFLIKEIIEYSPKLIHTESVDLNKRQWEICELMAQTGSFHARILNDFQKQSFFLQVKDLKLPQNIKKNYQVKAELLERTDSTLKYKINLDKNHSGIFYFGLLDYNNFKDGHNLAEFYKNEIKKIWKDF